MAHELKGYPTRSPNPQTTPERMVTGTDLTGNKFGLDIHVGNDTSSPVPIVTGTLSPTIYNVSLPVVNTEVSRVLTAGVKKFLVQNRGNGKLQLAFVATESGTNFITIPAGASYSEDGINSTVTLYMQSPKVSTVEVLEWA